MTPGGEPRPIPAVHAAGRLIHRAQHIAGPPHVDRGGRAVFADRGYGRDRARLDGRNGAAIWCGHGVFAHNLVKAERRRLSASAIRPSSTARGYTAGSGEGSGHAGKR